MIIIILVSFIVILLIYNYYVHHERNGRLINLIPGPTSYPIIGCTLEYVHCYNSIAELYKLLMTKLDEYYPIAKMWAFFLPMVSIRHPDDLQTILNSTIHIEKGFNYVGFYCWLGTGLLTSGGAKWHSRRKLLNPTFHVDILKQFVEIFIEEGENMTKSLKTEGDMIVKDLMPFLSEHTLNAICETIMGTSLRDLGEFKQPYIKAVHRMNEFLLHRLIWTMLNIDWLFPLTPRGREQRKILKTLHGFTERIIAERKLYHEQTNGWYLQNFNDNTLTINDDTSAEPKIRKKRLAMLDLLIAAARDGLMTDLDIREEVDTFMFEGHDTTATSLCYTLALLAEHKHIQDCARNEINAALQDNGEKFSIKVLQDLSYLERCIKESLRLYPSVFMISRTTEEDVKLQSYVVPAKTFLHLNIYGVHRDPNFWENPEVFDPDRFLSEKIRNRHPYSYIPFSAGPRNCIGQRFAILEMKAIVAHLIHNFYLEPIDDLKTLRIEPNLILHPGASLRVKFIRIYKM